MTTGVTPISSMEDLLRVLDENPEWVEAIQSRILGERMVGLLNDTAATLAGISSRQASSEETQQELVKAQTELTQHVGTLTQRMDDLTQRVDTLAQRMDDLTQRVDTLAQRMDDLTQRVDTLAQRMDDLTQRVDTLTQRMDDLTQRVGILTQRMDDLAQRVDTLAQRMDDLTQRVDILTQRMDDLTQRVDILTQRMDDLTQRVDILTQRMDDLTQRVDILTQRVDLLTQRMESLVTEVRALITRMDNYERRAERDFGVLKGYMMKTVARDEAANIADILDLRYVATLSVAELREMSDSSGDTSGITRGDLISFRRADLIAEATDGNGDTCYIAAEASYVIGRRDTDRATRNAGYLTRFTGRPAYPVVAGVSLHDSIQQLVSSGEVPWYMVSEEELTGG